MRKKAQNIFVVMFTECLSILILFNLVYHLVNSKEIFFFQDVQQEKQNLSKHVNAPQLLRLVSPTGGGSNQMVFAPCTKGWRWHKFFVHGAKTI